MLKTLLLSSIAFVGLAATAVAGPPLGALPLPGMPLPRAVLVNQINLPNSGEVNEAIHVGSYTYLHVTKGNKGTWLAIPRRDIPVGTQVSYAKGVVMKDFHSGSLNRTFETVVFLEGIKVFGDSAAAVAPGHPPVTALPPGHSPIPAAPADQPNLPNAGQVSEAIATNNYTYLNVTQNGVGTWLAIPRRDVPVGAQVRYAEGVPMKDFHSPSLDRTFAEVLFLGDVLLVDK